MNRVVIKVQPTEGPIDRLLDGSIFSRLQSTVWILWRNVWRNVFFRAEDRDDDIWCEAKVVGSLGDRRERLKEHPLECVALEEVAGPCDLRSDVEH